jgi:subtilisin family serine protease
MTRHAPIHPVRIAAAALVTIVVLGGAAAPRAGAAARIDGAVQRALAQAASGQPQLDVIVVLRRQAPLPSAPAANRAARLKAELTVLRALATREQRRLVALLAIRRHEGRVSRIRPYWIFNGLEVVADPDVVQEIAALPEVAEIQPNATVEAPSVTAATTGVEWNVARVDAPALWNMGYRGQGVVIASMDTGVDATHPDLASRWRGGTNSWYDPNGQHPTTPTDVSGHGTWTMGAMVGGDAGGTAIGVAPDARWIAVKIFNDRGVATTAGIHAGFQWLLDPDGNPATADAPHVVDDSWTLVNGGCDLTFQNDLRNLRAGGVLPIFAAGNGGPFAGTSLSPANNPEAFAVGGTDSGDLIDSGSSRGPSTCGQAAYPQLTAPGVDVRTTDLFGLYVNVSGTSIAAPHAAAALALLLGAFPNIDADRQAAALQSGAVDLGAQGPDYDYGAGRLDALEAYNWLAAAPDFTVAATPVSATAAHPASASYTVDVGAIHGFTGDVTLSLSGLSASRASWSFNPPTITGGAGSAQLTVSPTASLAPGTYPLTIQATSGSITHSAGVSLVVPAPPDFSLTASPSSASTLAGASVTYAVSAGSVGGFAGDIALSLSGLTGSQATWTFSPSTMTSDAPASELTVTPVASIAPGTYSLTITGTSGSITHTVSVTLVVTPPPDFTLSATPSSRSTGPGATVSYSVSAGRVGGFTGDIALSLSGLTTSQATWSFAPATITGGFGTSKLTVTTLSSLAPGSYSLTITGTSGAITHTANVTLVVTAPPDFGIAVTPASATVVAGQSTTYTVSVSSVSGFAGNVSLSLSGLPSGATGSFSRNPVRAPGTATLTVRTTRSTTRGTFTIRVTGSSGNLSHPATATLVVRS